MHLAAVAAVPDPPATLGEIGAAVWERLWTAGQGWLSLTTDLDVLTRLAEAHDERQAMREQIAADGYMVAGSQGQPRPHPLLTHLRALEAQMTRWESLCGFTPADRSRLGYAEVKKVSLLDEMANRRAQRGAVP
ncbi:phage terminase small subunit P27 family [Longispora fulva]|uniref:P27 family predicted phage terminase small subunit n=1 Tax=Longispora fulva TaxID=619741 RepID=A0A8J7KJC2_9ACTN|nr:phage terminase small subunit P27 family [Longispora fulva]MBG6140235.1 P27 family predicted phage terminase small subunit [Longispora fulva]